MDIEAVNFLEKLFYYRDEDHLCIGFQTLAWVYPFTTLLVAVGIRDIVHYRRMSGKRTHATGQSEGSRALSYLRFVGFFQFIGLTEGDEPGKQPGNPRYVPITVLTIRDLQGNGVLQERIDIYSRRLSTVIYRSAQDAAKAEMLSYCIREAVRNVFEHAETDECYIMAQRWSHGFAELAIADQGIGLYRTLQRAHEIRSAHESLDLALRPGISGSVASNNDDQWQNTGFGLYVMSQLGAKLGTFAIASDNLILFKNRDYDVLAEVPIRGTALKLLINTKEAEFFPNLLQQIVTEGEKEAGTIPGARKSASRQSKTTSPLW